MSSTEQRLQERMVSLIRSIGLHQPDRTPCGEPVAVSEAHALMELARDEALSPTGLAARLRLDRSTVTRLVQRLAARGWVARERDPRDGRAACLRLTAAGREVATQLATARAAKFASILATVPVQEREPVLRALDVLVRAIDDSGASGRADEASTTQLMDTGIGRSRRWTRIG